MLHSALRTAPVGLVIVVVLALSACQDGPGGSGGSTQQPPESRTHEFTIRANDFAITRVSTFTTLATAEYQASIITADDVKNGLVTAEVQTVSGSNVWLALPYVVHVGLASYSVSTTLTYAYGAGMVRIVVQGDVTQAEMSVILAEFDGYRIRVVVVPTRK